MSVRSQYDSASNRIISGNVGAKFQNATILNTPIPLGASSLDLAAITCQSGLYFQEAQVKFTFPNTSTLTDTSLYVSRGLSQADIFAQDNHIVATQTNTSGSDITVIFRIIMTIGYLAVAVKSLTWCLYKRVRN